MSLSTLKVFNRYVYLAATELIAQNIALFNDATRGAFVLRGAANQGDYSDEASYAFLSGLVRRRNAYGSGAVSEKELSMLLNTSVKIAAGTPPVRIDPNQWKWIQRSPAEAGVVIGKQLGEQTFADMLNTAIKAFVAATLNVGATVVYDGTAGNLSLGVMNTTASLFGDRSQAIAAWLMHSKSWHDMVGAAITNSNNLFVFGNIRVTTDGLGRPLIVTDAPDLTYTSSGTKYRTLGLVSGAAIVEQNADYTENVETNNGDENIIRTFQAEWSYNLGLKGYAWDKSNGGASPSNAALGTGTNWDKFATSVKDLAGVMVQTT